jgi:glycosyltransferase involved in cell wall biosynthesis
MKIALILENNLPGGVSTVVSTILNSNKFDFIIISLSKPTSNIIFKRDILYVENFYVERYTTIQYFLDIICKKRYFKKTSQKIIKLCIDNNVSILHFHTHPRYLHLGNLIIGTAPNLKLLWTEHSFRIRHLQNSSFSTKLFIFLYRKSFKHFNSIFVSKYIHRLYKELNLLDAQKMHISIENSVTFFEYQKKKNYEISETIKIVYVARLSNVKNHIFLFNVIKKLLSEGLDKKIELSLYGSGEIEEVLLNYVNFNNLNQNIIFHGNSNSLPDLLSKYDFAVFTSEAEGFPIALLEKLASGLPVVCANLPEILCYFSKDDGVIFYERNSLDDCVKNILHLISDVKIRENLGCRAKYTILNRFSYSLEDKYDEVYQFLSASKL